MSDAITQSHIFTLTCEQIVRDEIIWTRSMMEDFDTGEIKVLVEMTIITPYACVNCGTILYPNLAHICPDDILALSDLTEDGLSYLQDLYGRIQSPQVNLDEEF